MIHSSKGLFTPRIITKRLALTPVADNFLVFFYNHSLFAICQSFISWEKDVLKVIFSLCRYRQQCCGVHNFHRIRTVLL